ncbi:MAG TPA: His/Gly/Thr/Pro-type tRNA ligase C-terminal domain-containing protein, partial [Polyangiaceae bacterium]|nr:His/Gly/Thr/Pro-type tRNA ligase C-terminal domain-containing protein [Polyangiaceae bacterium]
DDAEVKRVTEELYGQLLEKGVEVFYDDRDERPGVKFKDADLIGVPLRVTVGDRGLDKGIVELKRRTQKESRNVPSENAVLEIWKEVELLRALDPKAAAPAPPAAGAAR